METAINQTINFVKDKLQNAEGGHDWWHIERVWRLAKNIAKTEQPANLLIVELAALLHDIADPKFYNGDETIGPNTASAFLTRLNIDAQTIEHVVYIIKNMSYSSSIGEPVKKSNEFNIVQDADRLDAIGAIGIARAFNYGGYKNREMYNPGIAPNLNLTKNEYKNHNAPTINHFYEKLFLLKNLMNTNTAKQMANNRHLFMQQFVEQFYNEWNGII